MRLISYNIRSLGSVAKTEIQNQVQTFKPTFMCIQNLMTLSMPVKLEKRDQEEYLLYGTKETFQC